jgi:hypothetical protein
LLLWSVSSSTADAAKIRKTPSDSRRKLLNIHGTRGAGLYHQKRGIISTVEHRAELCAGIAIGDHAIGKHIRAFVQKFPA